jgi:hypothetical protein
MRSFAQTATCSWMSGMIIRSARSASMTHARDHDSGVYASGGRMTRTYPLIQMSSSLRAYRSLPSHSLGIGRRLREVPEPACKLVSFRSRTL